MNKRITLTASVIIILSLIACDKRTQSNNSVEELSSSNYVQTETYTDCGPSSIPSSSSEVIPSSELASSSEQSSLPSSSAEASSSESISSSEIASSSEQIVSSTSQESSLEGTYYHVIFQNYDETVLYETDVLEGDEAIYVGETPSQPEDEEFTYEFAGWNKDLTNITSDVIAVAVYNAIEKIPWGPIIWF